MRHALHGGQGLRQRPTTTAMPRCQGALGRAGSSALSCGLAVVRMPVARCTTASCPTPLRCSADEGSRPSGDDMPADSDSEYMAVGVSPTQAFAPGQGYPGYVKGRSS